MKKNSNFLAANFLVLMALGAKHVESPFIELGQISTALYFGYFIVLLPLVTILENTVVFFSTIKSTDSKILLIFLLLFNI